MFDYYSKEECNEMVYQILDFFDFRPEINFDDSFVIKMKTQLDNGNTLSVNQAKALENIIRGWKIDQ